MNPALLAVRPRLASGSTRHLDAPSGITPFADRHARCRHFRAVHGGWSRIGGDRVVVPRETRIGAGRRRLPPWRLHVAGWRFAEGTSLDARTAACGMAAHPHERRRADASTSPRTSGQRITRPRPDAAGTSKVSRFI